MDFSTAVQAHANWKLKLSSFCKGVLREKLDVQSLGRDNACELGKWMQSDGRKFASHPEFKALSEAHTAFHRAAGAIAVMAQQGRGAEAEALLVAPTSDFTINSRLVTSNLSALRRKLEKSAA